MTLAAEDRRDRRAVGVVGVLVGEAVGEFGLEDFALLEPLPLPLVGLRKVEAPTKATFEGSDCLSMADPAT